MSETQQGGGTKPAAMAIPKGGFFKDKMEQGRYGPIFPKSPACYGFSILAKIIPGREEVFYEYAVAGQKRLSGRGIRLQAQRKACRTSPAPAAKD